MEQLLKLLEKELGYLPESAGLKELLQAGERIKCYTGDILIEPGEVNPDIFIVKSGILRFVDMNGVKERTYAFALPGNIVTSKYSFVKHQPSYYQVMTCVPSTVIRIPHAIFWEKVEQYPDLALWMLKYAFNELYLQEYKNCEVFNGTAKERFMRQLKDRPDILAKVPQKIIASYLGIAPEYYCSIKREYLMQADATYPKKSRHRRPKEETEE